MAKAKGSHALRSEGRPIDEIDARILSALDADGRLPMSKLAKIAGLTAPSVADRVRRLEADGVVRGFTLDVNPCALGYRLRAMVRIRPLPGKLHTVERMIEETPQFIECDKITGDDPFLVRMVAHTIEEMDEVLEALSSHAVTSTAIIKGPSFAPRLPPLGPSDAR